MRTATTSPLLHIIHWTWIDKTYSHHRDLSIMGAWGNGYCGLPYGGGMSADIGHKMWPRGPHHLRGRRVTEWGDGHDFGFR